MLIEIIGVWSNTHAIGIYNHILIWIKCIGEIEYVVSDENDTIYESFDCRGYILHQLEDVDIFTIFDNGYQDQDGDRIYELLCLERKHILDIVGRECIAW